MSTDQKDRCLYLPTSDVHKTSLVPSKGHIEDVNADGLLDIALHFNTAETGIQEGETSASLTGKTLDGKNIIGSDSIRIVGKR